MKAIKVDESPIGEEFTCERGHLAAALLELTSFSKPYRILDTARDYENNRWIILVAHRE